MSPMDHRKAVARTREIAQATISPGANALDNAGSFPTEAIANAR